MLHIWQTVFPAGMDPCIFKSSANAGGDVGKWWDSWSRGSRETILVLAKYGTTYQPLWSWTADEGICCPLSTGTGSAYLACSVNLSEKKPDCGLMTDKRSVTGKPHFKNTAPYCLTLTSLESLLMRRRADGDVYMDLTDTIRIIYPCAENKWASLPTAMNYCQSALN